MATVPAFVPDPDASFSQIIVPTSDTVRYNYLLRILAAAGKHVLYVGETGTGGPIPLHQEGTETPWVGACADLLTAVSACEKSIAGQSCVMCHALSHAVLHSAPMALWSD